MFTPEQRALLEGKLDKAVVKQRRGANGKAVAYLEAWHVIDMANEVFGFGNWDAETVDMKREHDPVRIPPTEEHPKVRVTVYSQDGSRKVVRERSGGHRAFGPTVGQAVEDCIKAAETDATKRAFVTFGNIFGLALYDREQRNVGSPEVASHRRQVAPGSAIAAIDEGFDQSEPQRHPTTSQRAVAAVKRPAPPNANGRGNDVLPY
jgi:recombination DNA repair RAD52 pathway protein